MNTFQKLILGLGLLNLIGAALMAYSATGPDGVTFVNEVKATGATMWVIVTFVITIFGFFMMED